MAELEMQRGGDEGAPPAAGGGGGLGKLKALFHGKRGALVMAVIAFAVIGLYALVRMRAGQGTPGAQAGVGAFPMAGSTQPASDAVGQQLEGLQAQIGNLTQQVSSTQATASTATTAGSTLPHVVGNLSGEDQGWFYGARPTAVPEGEHLQWRWTSHYLTQHPEFSAQPASGYGPPTGTPTPEYSWEWQVANN